MTRPSPDEQPTTVLPQATLEQPTVVTAPATRRARVWRHIPSRVGRARTSTLVIGCLFVLLLGLDAALPQDPGGTVPVTTSDGRTIQVPRSYVPGDPAPAPAPAPTTPATTSAPAGTTPATTTSRPSRTSATPTAPDEDEATTAPATTGDEPGEEAPRSSSTPSTASTPASRAPSSTSRAPASTRAPATTAAPTSAEPTG